MSGFVWLASYPKSGNTWFRMFLANLRRGEEGPVHLHDIEKTPIASSRIVFDRELAYSSTDLSDDAIDILRPEAYRHAIRRESEDVFSKVHDAYTRNGRAEPIFPKDATRCALYFIRNPFDVCASYVNHTGSTVDQIVALMGNPAGRAAGQIRKPARQFRQLMLDWSGHVTSWTDDAAEEFPVHVMRYEDMKADPVPTFQAAAKFADLPHDRAAVERALEYSRFERLKEQEKESGFKEKPGKSKAFFRKGTVGGWREELPAAAVDAIRDGHADVLRRFGYLDEQNRILV